MSTPEVTLPESLKDVLLGLPLGFSFSRIPRGPDSHQAVVSRSAVPDGLRGDVPSDLHPVVAVTQQHNNLRDSGGAEGLGSATQKDLRLYLELPVALLAHAHIVVALRADDLQNPVFDARTGDDRGGCLGSQAAIVVGNGGCDRVDPAVEVCMLVGVAVACPFNGENEGLVPHGLGTER